MTKLLTGIVLLVGSVSVVLAHHPFASEFDASKPVTLTGTVTNVQWSPPHVNIQMDAKDGNGPATSWKLEGASPATLEQNGWKSTTLKKGDSIIAMAYRSKDGSATVSARSISLANGTSMVICDEKEDGGPVPQNGNLNASKTRE